MDRSLYVAMSGAKETLRAQTANNHNLANASTTGFRADLSAFQTRAVAGTGYASRAYATNSTTGWDSNVGAVQSTGRDLDVAVNGPGWLVVQGKDGTEGYTRAGDLHVDPTGMLLDGSGRQVLGEGGPITVPPSASTMVAGDGSISIVPLGQGPETTAIVGRLKLVNPPDAALERSEDGLFRMKDRTQAPSDAAVRVTNGSLESSNVNIADAMVKMIELSRHYDMQIKAMHSAEENAQSATQLLKLG
jgi:flagellar basal-body rod protein FlgF